MAVSDFEKRVAQAMRGQAQGDKPAEFSPTISLRPVEVKPEEKPKGAEAKKQEKEPPAFTQQQLMDLQYEAPSKKGPALGMYGSQLGLSAGGGVGTLGAAPIQLSPEQQKSAALSLKLGEMQYGKPQKGKPEVGANPADLAPFISPQEVIGNAPPAPRGGGGQVKIPESEEWLIGPQLRGAYRGAQADEQRAVVDKERDEEKQNEAERVQMALMEHQAARREAEMARQEASRQAMLKSYHEQQRSLVEEAQTHEIDSKRLWNNKSTGEKILGTIALALSGIGAAFGGHGGHNTVQEKIDKETDRDIQEQKDNIGLKQKGVENMNGLFHSAMQRFGDERSAEAATHVAYLERAELQIKQLALQSNNVQIQHRAQDMLASIAMKRAEWQNKFTQYHPASMAGGGGGAMQNENPVVDVNAGALVPNGDGTYTEARTVQDAEKIRARAGFEQQMSVLQNEAAKVYQEYGKSAAIPGTDGYNRLRILREQAIPIQSLATQQGVVREFERDPTLASIGLNYSSWDVISGHDPVARLKQAQKTMMEGSKQLLREQGGIIVAPQQKLSANGKKLLRQWTYVGEGPKPGQAMQEQRPVPGMMVKGRISQ